jgi:hypothetical protein
VLSLLYNPQNLSKEARFELDCRSFFRRKSNLRPDCGLHTLKQKPIPFVGTECLGKNRGREPEESAVALFHATVERFERPVKIAQPYVEVGKAGLGKISHGRTFHHLFEYVKSCIPAAGQTVCVPEVSEVDGISGESDRLLEGCNRFRRFRTPECVFRRIVDSFCVKSEWVSTIVESVSTMSESNLILIIGT